MMAIGQVMSIRTVVCSEWLLVNKVETMDESKLPPAYSSLASPRGGLLVKRS